MPWLLVFFLTPIAEMYLLIEVAGYINTWPTVFLVMLTAVIGVALLKRQGLATLTRGVNRMNAGEIPATEIAEGLLLAVAGALLVTPGFITDGVGFALLFPPSRVWLAGLLLKRVEVQGVQSQGVYTQRRYPPGTESHAGQPERQSGPVTIEGDYERKN
jgi:UPF0716 protein FxsA